MVSFRRHVDVCYVGNVVGERKLTYNLSLHLSVRHALNMGNIYHI